MMWSGGKDSALAWDRARRGGIEVARRGEVRRPQLAFGTCLGGTHRVALGRCRDNGKYLTARSHEVVRMPRMLYLSNAGTEHFAHQRSGIVRS